MTNLIDQAKTIMQGCGNLIDTHNISGIQLRARCGFNDFMCEKCKAKASQMLIDLTIFKEKLTHLFQNKECPDGDVVAMGLMISAVSPFAKYINSIIEEINSAIEILEGK
jgi:hypothetical protein